MFKDEFLLKLYLKYFRNNNLKEITDKNISDIEFEIGYSISHPIARSCIKELIQNKIIKANGTATVKGNTHQTYGINRDDLLCYIMEHCRIFQIVYLVIDDEMQRKESIVWNLDSIYEDKDLELIETDILSCFKTKFKNVN